ncbi:acyltransferase [Granulicella pectinivorans]|nr:acyltransferase [Granulicella pectinivorans]
MIVKLLLQTLKNSARLVRDRMVLESFGAKFENCRIDPRAIIRVGHDCHLKFGRNVVIGALTFISVEPDLHAAPGDVANLDVGDFTYIGEGNNLRAAGGIRIGSNCLISQGVSIISSNHSSELGRPITEQPSRTDKKGVTIQDDVWIGTNATILPGVTIGKGAIVAAGSVVTTSVADYTIVAGVPARFLKARQ